MKKNICIVLICLFCHTFIKAQTKHFISDDIYRSKVSESFNNKMKLIGNEFYDTKELNTNNIESEALQFLYAYMPLADVTDYTTDFYLKNVRASFNAQKEMAWGNKIPELLFRHFVLPIRVNNENLDESRMVFYKELKDRVKGKEMYDAILEVNHWCHEHMAYQPSDARTSSPLASMLTATGRCGEESTFAVAALRSVGIPARQVYTPRWAHTDDNHAWVEAWADGTWYFLGACEPEPVLNLGWFNAPASRALLMHTRAFGDYNGPEEVMLRTQNFTEINLIDNYATTARVDFIVTDEKGVPVDNARVDFKIYNYAEFYTAVTKYTDKKGKTFLTAGKGDMLVWASKNGKYGYKVSSFGKDKNINIQIYRNEDSDVKQLLFAEDSMKIVPPAENNKMSEVSDELRKLNQIRFAYEDSLRNAYTSTFLNEEKANLISKKASKYLIKSRGNHSTIESFINKHKDNMERVLSLLETLSDKDLRDITTDILEDNFTAKSNQLSPRVEDEMIIMPFKHYFENYFDYKTNKQFIQDPQNLVSWIKKNIRLNPDTKALKIAQTPIGVIKSKLTDTRSRDIFFVDVARSLGIEARKDVVTSKIQYKKNGIWIDVDFSSGASTITPTGTLKLDYTVTKLLDDPKYYSHFTISRLKNGTTSLLNFDEGQVDMGGGTSWSNTFKNGVKLDVGTYILTTGTRLANGSVLASNRIFNICKDKTTEFDLHVRQSQTEVSVIGNFDSESKFSLFDEINKKVGEEKTILSQTGRGYYIIGILGVGQEPTNHALHDIAKMKSTFDKWERPLVLLFESKDDAIKFKSNDFGDLPNKTIFGIDNEGNIRNQIVTQMKLQNKTQLPLFIIADTFNRVLFVSQGYTIGLGEQLQKVIKQL